VTTSVEDFRQRLLESLPRLRNFARSYCGNRADADDAVQGACEHALVRWQQWTGLGAFDHWLTKILVNAWRDEKRSRRVREGPDLESIPEHEDPSQNHGDHLFLEQVNSEVIKLPDAQREVLVLVAAEGFSYREVADMLGVPMGTVMSRLCRARQTLMERFADEQR
jgi:RNA polymerase sigma-70 factor (ECF subfamily)